jgi:glucose/arabinose dehydrogenase
MRRLIVPAIAAVAIACSSLALAQEGGIRLEPVAQGLDSPLLVTAPAGDPRLFVVEQTGRILILVDGAVQPAPFLDVSDRISVGGERGLLGLAFHPDYASNGRFFVNYTDADGNTQVVGYTASGDAADPASATPLFSVDQPFGNHNGGWLGFGPDGLLYVGMGDGGAGGDPGNRAQDPQQLLGKILRLDVDAGTAPEIFATGVRNPWRMAFDGDNLYVADVGQVAHEEISVITTADAGANLGWKVMEGLACYEAATCDTSGFVLPILTYGHDSGRCSITGGLVYRGAALPALTGQYFFSDFCDGHIRSLTYADGQAIGETDWTDQLGAQGQVTSFGTDSAGELYVMTIDGNLSKLVPAS